METEIYWIAILGTVIVLFIPFSMISSKMLDGFGKSMYSLLFTVMKIGFLTNSIYVLNTMLSNGSSVLIGVTVTEIIFAIVYYMFLRYLFKNFDRKYENKDVVKTFKSENNAKIKDNSTEKNKMLNDFLIRLGFSLQSK